jgi:hypothetical protein
MQEQSQASDEGSHGYKLRCRLAGFEEGVEGLKEIEGSEDVDLFSYDNKNSGKLSVTRKRKNRGRTAKVSSISASLNFPNISTPTNAEETTDQRHSKTTPIVMGTET